MLINLTIFKVAWKVPVCMVADIDRSLSTFCIHWGFPLHYKFVVWVYKILWFYYDFTWEAHFQMWRYSRKLNTILNHLCVPNKVVKTFWTSMKTIWSIISLKQIILLIETKFCVRNASCNSATCGTVLWIF